MSLAQSKIARLTPSLDENGPSGAAGIGAKSWLALTIATLLALAAIGAVDGKPSSPAPGDSAVTGIETWPAQILDGRGKWSGYSR